MKDFSILGKVPHLNDLIEHIIIDTLEVLN